MHPFMCLVKQGIGHTLVLNVKRCFPMPTLDGITSNVFMRKSVSPVFVGNSIHTDLDCLDTRKIVVCFHFKKKLKQRHNRNDVLYVHVGLGRSMAGFDNDQRIMAASHSHLSFAHPNFSTSIVREEHFDRGQDISLSEESHLRLYPCPQCEKSFSNKSARWNHIEAIHENNNFRCVCGKVYSYRTGLMRHQKSCTMFFTQSGSR